MSLYTTATASYVLSKYSRSRTSPSAVEGEWQHFTNPAMRLVLDVQRSSPGELTSMRVRVLWNMDLEMNVNAAKGVQAHPDGREVVFEDLDLLSFSSLPVYRTPQSSADQGLPLKAVYRDSVVGIRYLHQSAFSSGRPPVYRRFQVTFGTTAGAAQFIEAIRPVCPCRANPPPTHQHLNQTQSQNQSSSQRLMRQHTTMLIDGALAPPVATPRAWGSSSSITSMSGISTTTAVGTPTSTATMSSESGVGSGACLPMQPPDRPEGLLQAVDNIGNPGVGSLPSSSQPGPPSSFGNGWMPPPPMPRSLAVEPPVSAPAGVSTGVAGATNQPQGSELLSSLSSVSQLYNLSQSDLERVVAEVIREEGFIRLLDNLNGLWRVKGFLPR